MGTHPIFESDFDCLTEMSNGGLPRPSLASSASPGINSSGSRLNESILAQDDAQDTPKSRQRVQNDTRRKRIKHITA